MKSRTPKVKLVKLSIPKSELNKLSAQERKRYIMLTCMMRDLTLLNKCLIYSKNDTPKEQVIGYANTMAGIFFLTTLISKITEMWVFLKENRILDELEKQQISPELQNCVSGINAFFDKEEGNEKNEKIFKFIRNKLTFHYEYQNNIDKTIHEGFNKFKDNDFEMWLCKTDSANDIFPSTNAIILLTIFNEMGKVGFSGDDHKKMKDLFDLAIQGTKLFQEFCPLYLTEAFHVKWTQAQDIELEVPDVLTVKLPIVVAKKINP